MTKYKPTAEDLYRKYNEVFGAGAAEKRSLSKPTGDAGSQGGQAFGNPMVDPWDLIRAGESGAMVRFPMTGTEGQVPMVQADGSLAYADPPSGTGAVDSVNGQTG